MGKGGFVPLGRLWWISGRFGSIDQLGSLPRLQPLEALLLLGIELFFLLLLLLLLLSFKRIKTRLVFLLATAGLVRPLALGAGRAHPETNATQRFALATAAAARFAFSIKHNILNYMSLTFKSILIDINNYCIIKLALSHTSARQYFQKMKLDCRPPSLSTIVINMRNLFCVLLGVAALMSILVGGAGTLPAAAGPGFGTAAAATTGPTARTLTRTRHINPSS